MAISASLYYNLPTRARALPNCCTLGTRARLHVGKRCSLQSNNFKQQSNREGRYKKKAEKTAKARVPSNCQKKNTKKNKTKGWPVYTRPHANPCMRVRRRPGRAANQIICKIVIAKLGCFSFFLFFFFAPTCSEGL